MPSYAVFTLQIHGAPSFLKVDSVARLCFPPDDGQDLLGTARHHNPFFAHHLLQRQNPVQDFAPRPDLLIHHTLRYRLYLGKSSTSRQDIVCISVSRVLHTIMPSFFQSVEDFTQRSRLSLGKLRPSYVPISVFADNGIRKEICICP